MHYNSSVAEHWTIFSYALYLVCMYCVSLIQLLLPNKINHYHIMIQFPFVTTDCINGCFLPEGFSIRFRARATTQWSGGGLDRNVLVQYISLPYHGTPYKSTYRLVQWWGRKPTCIDSAYHHKHLISNIKLTLLTITEAIIMINFTHYRFFTSQFQM